MLYTSIQSKTKKKNIKVVKSKQKTSKDHILEYFILNLYFIIIVMVLFTYIYALKIFYKHSG